MQVSVTQALAIPELGSGQAL